jgi:bifunctional DNA-binding transcriptional regulator/antitoxin component of YhaV-PrlF toxin-antitoxin module
LRSFSNLEKIGGLEMFLKEKKLPKVSVERSKIYGKGTLNLPKKIMEVAGIKPGEEVLLQAKQGEIKIRRIKTPRELLGALPVEGKVEVFPYYFRGALGDALEFFGEVQKGLPFGKNWEVGNFYGKVYLKPENSDIRTSIHISYFEDPAFPEGAITIDGGIKQFLQSREDIAIVDQNLEKIKSVLNRLNLPIAEISPNSYLLKEAPTFDIGEGALIGSVLTLLSV